MRCVKNFDSFCDNFVFTTIPYLLGSTTHTCICMLLFVSRRSSLKTMWFSLDNATPSTQNLKRAPPAETLSLSFFYEPLFFLCSGLNKVPTMQRITFKSLLSAPHSSSSSASARKPRRTRSRPASPRMVPGSLAPRVRSRTRRS